MTTTSGAIAFSALGCSVAVHADDREVATYLRDLFRHLEPPSERPQRSYVVTAAGGKLDISADGVEIGDSIQALVRDIDEWLIASSPRLLIHGAGATIDGRAVALVGRTGSGKSTLVAGLVRAGCGYLTDEFVSPDWNRNLVVPYARFITLRENTAAVDAGTRQVDPDRLRPGSIAPASPLGGIVFLDHGPDRETTIARIGRPDALMALAETTFHFHRHGTRALSALGEVVREAECFRLRYSDFNEAVDAVLTDLASSA
jgi:hypothetical protein